jgi:hypothetical protein
MRVLVTGSRDWPDQDFIWDMLWLVWRKADRDEPLVLVHGHCRKGADRMADDWAADAVDVTVERHPAQWEGEHGFDRAAGFRRNQEMVDLGADLCLAFIYQASRGASHTATQAEKAGIETWRFSR